MKIKSYKKTIFIALLGILLGAGVLLTISAANRGAVLLALETEADVLQRENSELNSTIASQTSLSKISESAQALGFSKPENLIYLSKEEPVAWKRD